MVYASQWNKDIKHSEDMNKYVDEVYARIFPVKKVTRLTKSNSPHILDQYFHVDTIIELVNGMIITSQEKIRRPEYMKYNEFTLEYKSNNLGVEGEFSKLCTDIYFYAYADAVNGLERVYVFKPYNIKVAVSKGELVGKLQQNTVHSTASFFAYPFSKFQDSWFVYRYDRNQGSST